MSAVSLTEILGFITGAACVALAVKENVWNWPIGILNNVFFLLLFWQSKLYADSVLQIVYVVIGVYGWWNWVYGGEHRGKLELSRMSRASFVWMSLATVLGTLAIRWLLIRLTDSSVPTLDALTTSLSLVAQYMLGRKWLENWFFWIAADVIYIGLYRFKGLNLTAILYAVFLVMCVAGWREWSKTLDQSPRWKADEVAG
jgi:nicotinamide mononucleotide transporter